MKKRSQNQKGFTLIELLVVISIIGLLSSVVFAATTAARAKAQAVAMAQSLIQLRNALEIYKSDTGYYPYENKTTGGGPGWARFFEDNTQSNLTTNLTNITVDGVVQKPFLPVYISKIPNNFSGYEDFDYMNKQKANSLTLTCGNSVSLNGYILNYYSYFDNVPLPRTYFGGVIAQPSLDPSNKLLYAYCITGN